MEKKVIETEIEFSISRRSNNGWSVRIRDNKSRARLIEFDLTNEEMGIALGTLSIYVPAELHVSDKFGKKLEVKRYYAYLSSEDVYGLSWEVELNLVQEAFRTIENDQTWEITGEPYNWQRESRDETGRLYEFNFRRWV